MKISDYLALGWDQLKRRKVVTALCAAGIAIGSASIIVALSFGESVTHYAAKQMNYYLKTDEITVFGGRSEATDSENENGITPLKLNLIRTLPHVKTAAGYERLGQFPFTVDSGKTGYVELTATDLMTLPDFGFMFQQGGVSDLDNVIVLSYPATLGIRDARSMRPAESVDALRSLSYPLYQKQIVLEKTIAFGKGAVKKLEFPVRVVAIEKKPEGISDNTLRFMPKTAYISHGLAERIKNAVAAASPANTVNEFPGVTEAKVKVESAAFVAETEKRIQLLKLSTSTNLRQQENMKREFVILKLIFGGIGAFILFVASISIVVAMTMSTYQRRRQIGIMKVLGANLKQIRNMFVVESALLGLLGGLLGILLSHWVVWGINILVIRFGDQPPGSDPEILFISWWILPLGLFFALMTGVLSGIFPAIRASRTDALTAIKRE